MGNILDTMQAMVLEKAGCPLIQKTLPIPHYGEREVLVKVLACGICRTDLHVIDGDLKHPKLPIVPGHEIIGKVVASGAKVTTLRKNMLVGIPWLGYTCGECAYCLKGKENLCENALFTGYTRDGGFAEYTVGYEHYCLPLPAGFIDPAKAPLLCAGLIGYRSYSILGKNVRNLGIYGFGAAAHILIQVAIQQHKKIYAFTRDGDVAAQQFALQMGAAWAGDASQEPPEKLDGAIIFAPAGELVPQALRNVDKGGSVVCGGIHMSDIPSFPYDILWGERSIHSVANLTRQDAIDFIDLTHRLPIKTEVQLFSLEQTNEALNALRSGTLTGAAVIIMP